MVGRERDEWPFVQFCFSADGGGGDRGRFMKRACPTRHTTQATGRRRQRKRGKTGQDFIDQVSFLLILKQFIAGFTFWRLKTKEYYEYAHKHFYEIFVSRRAIVSQKVYSQVLFCSVVWVVRYECIFQHRVVVRRSVSKIKSTKNRMENPSNMS